MKALALFLAFGAMLAAALPSSAQQPHWLVGTWEGEVRGLGNNPTGSKRTIIIRSVSPDGTSAQGTWRTDAGVIAFSLSVNGDMVSFTPPSANIPGNQYKLVRQGNVLEGSWFSSTGRSGGVTFNKK
jgi:hypothetical protein